MSKNTPPTGGPSPDAIKKIQSSPEYKKAIAQLNKRIGKKALNVVQAEISKKDVKEAAAGYAIDQVDAWLDERRQAKQAKLDKAIEKKVLGKIDPAKLSTMTQAEKDKAVQDYKDKSNKGIRKLLNMPKRIAEGIVNGIGESAHRSWLIKDVRNQAKRAILETGKLEAGQVAAERFRKLRTRKNPVDSAKAREVAFDAAVRAAKKMGNDDNHFLDRVEMKAKGKGEFANDTKVTLKDANSSESKAEKNEIKELYSEYMQIVTKTSNTSVRGDKVIEKARKNLLEELKKANKGKAITTNHEELLKQIGADYRGIFRKELSANGQKYAKEKHQAALDVIDGYLEKNLKVMSGRVKTGLESKMAYAKNSDKAVLKWGVIAGTLAGSLAAVGKGIFKSKAVQLCDSAIATFGVKAAFGGLFGGIAGGIRKKIGQRHDEMRQAIGVDAMKAGDKTHYDKVLVADKVKELNTLASDLRKGKDVRDQLEKALGEMRARRELQEKKKIDLMVYNGRENIEKQRFELLDAMTEARQAMIRDTVKSSSKNRDAATKEVEAKLTTAAKQASETLLNGIKDVQKAKNKEIGKAALKGAVVGAIGAAVATVVSDELFHDGAIRKEVFSALGIGGEDSLKPFVGGGLFTKGISKLKEMAKDMNNVGGINVGPKGDGTGIVEAVKNLNGDNGAEKLIEYRSGAAVLIEDDVQGGVAIGFDNNGNGMLDAGEYLRGEGDLSGVDLTNNAQFESVRQEMMDNYNLDIQRDAIDVTKYNQVMVNDYLENVDNKVNVNNVIFDTDNHDITFGVPQADPSVDGMTQYVVAVDGAADGDTLFIDLDGNGKGSILEFKIENGKAVIPADVVDTSEVGNNGVAGFFGRATVGRMDGDTMVSYTEAVDGATLGSTDSLTASVTENGYAFTVVNGEGETVSNFAINTQGKVISNTSEIFNGIGVGESDRLPAGFSTLEGIEEHGVLASGEKMPEVGDWKGGYNAQYDSSINYPFKNNNHSLVGTPMVWDADGDGIMNAAEEASYIKQMLVRTATNPYVLGQNASNYGLLEPDTLAKNLFNGDMNAMTETLKSWGVADGVIDSERELQSVLDHLKLPENAGYYDQLVNSTIHEMQDQLAGGGFEQGTLTDRISTYINKDGSIDTKGNASVRVAMFAYKTDPVTGERVYVGNKGWWVRKYYGEEGGKVADLPLCEQKAVVVGKDEHTGKEGSGKELSDKEAGDKEIGDKEGTKKEMSDKEGAKKEVGEKEAGEKETGDKEVGEKELGEKESGDKEAGDKEIGDKEAGEKESGQKEVGDKEAGDKEAGDKEAGDKEIGDKEAGEKESGQKEVGDKEVGDKEIGDKEAGEKESGQKEVGDKEVGDKESGQKEVGDKEVGDKEIGDKEVGEKESGQKEVGDKEVGDKEIGDKEAGDKEIGDKEVGEKESGQKEIGDKEIGDKEIGDKEIGDKEIGEKEIGEKEIGGKEGSMNSGDKVGEMDTTEDMDNIATATDGNHATTGTPGSSMGGTTSETVYNDSMVLNEDGKPMTNSDGETYIKTTGETEEEVLQNIEDGTQTTHSTATTNYDPAATGSVSQDLGALTDENGKPIAGSGIIDEQPAPVLGNPGSAADNYEYTQEGLDDMFESFF